MAFKEADKVSQPTGTFFADHGIIGQSASSLAFQKVNDQVADLAALIDENNSLKRTIYKYENTLAQLDSIFRRDNDKEECIYELKKLTES